MDTTMTGILALIMCSSQADDTYLVEKILSQYSGLGVSLQTVFDNIVVKALLN
jgi:hypothetical protein